MTIDGQKMTVVGNVDPAKLREKTEQKTHKKVELISPQPKKDGGEKENAKGKDNSGGDGKKEKKKDNKDGGDAKKSDEKEVKKLYYVTNFLLTHLESVLLITQCSLFFINGLSGPHFCEFQCDVLLSF